MLHPGVVVRKKGTIQGNGLFSTCFIPEGTVLWQLKDPTFTWDEIQVWPAGKIELFRKYGFQCGHNLYSLPFGDSRENNHSCHPNMWWSGSDKLLSRWDIQPGEELTYDYASSEVTLPMQFDCSCGSEYCRKKVTNLDCLDVKWQEQYGSHLPAYTLAAIDQSKRMARLAVECMYLGPKKYNFSNDRGVRGYVSELKEQSSNYVGFVEHNSSDSFEIIKETSKDLEDKGVPFCWICEDGREPENARFLEQMGGRKEYIFWSMFHEKNDCLPQESKQVIVKKVDVSILKNHAGLIARELDCSEAYVRQTLSHGDCPEAGATHAYAAYIPGDILAGFGLLIDHPDEDVSVLRMAVVLREYRGQGVYKELFRKRAAHAYASGVQMLISHAYEKTAAPILVGLGMKKDRRFTMYSVPSPLDS